MAKEKATQIEKIRHSICHLMSMAIEKMYPDIKVGLGMGPYIENGFYQDYDLRGQSINEEMFPKLEKHIKKMIAQNIKFEHRKVSIKEGLEIYKDDEYKCEIINDLAEQGEKEVHFYKSDWFDNVCAGPHVESTKEINPDAFKIMSTAGAYWKGDEKNKMLTRIYGVAFETKEELDDYLKKQEEAKNRDHRLLNKDLDLYHVDQMVGQGLPLWQPKGAMLWRLMEEFWYKEHLKGGYELVRTPHIGSRKLWETSGHWGFYSDSMYPPIEIGQSLEDKKEGQKVDVKQEYLLKPMNCPLQIVLYKAKKHSYRELPIRWAECGTVYRYEKSGEISGLTRVRGFTQDDAHIICRKEQVEEELKRVIDFITFIFQSFGFYDYKIYYAF
jgi:threonyl-tRNA synthetase